MNRNYFRNLRSAAIAALLLNAVSGSRADCGPSQSATFTLLPGLGGTTVQPNQMNASGQITGYAFTAGNVTARAFLYSGGVMTSVGGDGTQGFGINSAGDVVGTVEDTLLFETHAALFSNGTTTDLGTLGGTFSYALAINDAGQIAGDSALDTFAFSAFLYSNNTMTGIGDFNSGFGSFTAGMNESGTVIGDALNEFFENRAFSYANGVLTDLGSLGGGYSSPMDINDAGVIVGESSDLNGETHAFVYSSGTMTDLGTLGGTFSTALAVNTSNQIAGYFRTAGDDFSHAFIHSGGVMSDLGTLGGNESQPNALNNLGVVIGWADATNGTRRAVRWQNGVATDLNTLLPANSGWVLQSAVMINDAGRIVGNGTFNGNFSWFIMDPGTGGPANQPPVAVAIAPTNAECGGTILLDGSQSSDPDNDPLTYEWSSSGTVFGTNATLSASAVAGEYSITLKVTDPCGASSEATVSVNVVDTTAPSISCPGQLGLTADANCQAQLPNLTGLATVSDACSETGSLVVSQNPAAGTMLGKGSHTVTLTVVDADGNSASCDATVVVSDTTAPVIGAAPAPQNLLADANCQATVPIINVSATDNCTAANALTYSQVPAAGTLLGVGTHNVVVTVTDADGNSSSTNVSLTVVDLIAPTIVSAPTTLTVPGGAGCQGQVPNVLGNVVASDNCTAANALIITQSPAAGTTFSGSQLVTVTVTDASGNSTSANVLVSAEDVTPPVVVTVSATPNVLAPSNNQLVPVAVSVVATDNCDSAPVSQIVSIVANEALEPGEAQITGALTATLKASKNKNGTERVYTIMIRTTDAAGNEATGSVNVTVPKNSNGGGGGKKDK